MESEEEVHSDGSFELVNIDEYDSEPEHVTMDAVVANNMEFSDDGSYDLLCSEVSDTLVITDGVAESEFFYSQSEGEMEYNDETKSDHTEGDVELRNETTSDSTGDVEINREVDFDLRGATGIESATNFDLKGVNMGINKSAFDSDLEMQPSPERVKKGKKRNLMDMMSENPNMDLFEFPALIGLKEDIKEVAKNHIIRYLPAKSLVRSRLVSKEWNQWISGPFFAHMQSQYFRKTSGFFRNKADNSTHFISLENYAYGVPYPSLAFIPRQISIRSSCNGLLLCQALDDPNEYFVCNPANNKWVKIPPSSYYHGEKPKIVLAFEPSSLNFEPCYKAVCPFSLPDPTEGPIVYFDIYDSKTQSWRISDTMCVDLDESEVKGDGIFVDGFVYWETTGGELLGFELKDEFYGIQTIPFGRGGSLSKINGEICYVKAQYHHLSRSCLLDVYGGGIMSLKESISFNVSNTGVEGGELMDCVVLANSCDDVIAVTMEMSDGWFGLYAYHVKDQKVEGPWYLRGSRELFPYVNSLVSLEG